MIGGRGRDRTGDPLLAKHQTRLHPLFLSLSLLTFPTNRGICFRSKANPNGTENVRFVHTSCTVPKSTDRGRDESCKCFSIREKVGGRDRDRTGDPLLAKQVLSQLSYTPTAATLFDSKAFAASRKLRKPTFYPSLCQNSVKTPVARTLLCQNSRHFVGPAIDFVQRFPVHLQLHLRILLEHLRITLTKHLGDPLIRHASGAKPCCVGGSQIIEPEIPDSGAFQSLSPGCP